jgi:hypothetical protein
MFSSIDGGHSQILRQHLPVGPLLTFFALMVGTPGSPIAPPRGLPLTFSKHRWWALPDPLATPPRGPTSTSFTLKVGATKSLTTLARGPTVDVFYIDAGRSRISDSTSEGVHHQRFLSVDGGHFRTLW